MSAAVHPQWCDPRYCQPTDVGLLHQSAPVTRGLPTAVWHFQLTRHEDDAVELIVTVESDTQPTCQIDIPIVDLQAVTAAFDVERGRALFLSAPVVHDSRAAA